MTGSGLVERVAQGMTTVEDAETVRKLIDAIQLNEEFPTDGPTLLEYTAYELEQHKANASCISRKAKLEREALEALE